MKLLCEKKTASAIGLAAAVCALVIGAVDNAAAQSKPPKMTVTIINNDPNYNIYPVYTTGGGGVSNRARAWFQVLNKDVDASPYPQRNYRFYINPTGTGIPPKGQLTVTVPVVSTLVPPNQIQPDQNEQAIDWWAGGRIELFDGPTCAAKPNNPDCDKPPAILTSLFIGKEGQIKITPFQNGRYGVPTCGKAQGATCQPLLFFKDTTVFGNNLPSQTLEFTLGAVNANSDNRPNQVAFLMDPENLDIDVSYVDTAYMPAALAPFNPGIPNIGQSGYIGSPMPVDDFRKALNKFLGDYDGWPQYVANISGQNQTILKLPSMIQMTGAGSTGLTPKPWKPVDATIATVKACFTNQPCATGRRPRPQGRDASAFCQNVQAVEQLFRCNYKNYAAIYKTKCDPTGNPVDLTDDLLIAHIYGFSPFVEARPNKKDCNPKVNLLENTPGYSANNSALFHQVKEQSFDVLQRWKGPVSDPYPAGAFDPWWLLIHANKKDGYPTEYANIPNAYAYSVDDAVGNLQADGTGFFIAVGGTDGLPNPNPASPPIIVGLGFAKTDAVRFTKYGVCQKQPNKDVKPDFPAFDLNALWSNLGRCPITLMDNKDQLYTFKVKPGPYPYDPDTDKSRAMIDCSDNTPGTRAADWCSRVYAYAIKVPHGDQNHAITPPACKNQTGTNCQ